MFSLQRFLSKGDKFFDLLEASADEARDSVQALLELIEAPQEVPNESRHLEEFALRWRQDKRITEEVTSLLCSSFITPLEREDIEALSRALSRIPKTIKKFAEHLVLSRPHLPAGMFTEQAALLKHATDVLNDMVRQLRGGIHLDKIQELNGRLQKYEGAGDKLILSLLQDLYSGRYEAMQMIVLRDLYELLEKVIDRCRDAGNVILQISLKDS